MAADLSDLDLLIIQIDGIHLGEDLMPLAAVGIDGTGEKHPLGVIEGTSSRPECLWAGAVTLIAPPLRTISWVQSLTNQWIFSNSVRRFLSLK